MAAGKALGRPRGSGRAPPPTEAGDGQSRPCELGWSGALDPCSEARAGRPTRDQVQIVAGVHTRPPLSLGGVGPGPARRAAPPEMAPGAAALPVALPHPPFWGQSACRSSPCRLWALSWGRRLGWAGPIAAGVPVACWRRVGRGRSEPGSGWPTGCRAGGRWLRRTAVGGPAQGSRVPSPGFRLCLELCPCASRPCVCLSLKAPQVCLRAAVALCSR